MISERRKDARRLRRELRARLIGVQLGQDRGRRLQLGAAGREAAGQCDENAPDLLALFLEGLGERVVGLHHFERLDEERLSRAGFLVHDAREAVLPVGAHGHAVPAALLRDVAFREDVGARPRELLEALHDVAAEPEDGRADREKPRRGRVLDPAVGFEDDGTLGEKIGKVGERQEQPGEVGEIEVRDRHRRARALGALREDEEVEEVFRREGPALRPEAGEKRERLRRGLRGRPAGGARAAPSGRA